MTSALRTLYSKYYPNSHFDDFPGSNNDITPTEKINFIIQHLAKKYQMPGIGECAVYTTAGLKPYSSSSFTEKKMIFIPSFWFDHSLNQKIRSKNKDNFKKAFKNIYPDEILDFIYDCLTDQEATKILKHLIVKEMISMQGNFSQQRTDIALKSALVALIAGLLAAQMNIPTGYIVAAIAASFLAPYILLSKKIKRSEISLYAATASLCPGTKEAALRFQNYYENYQNRVGIAAKFDPRDPSPEEVRKIIEELELD